MEKLVRKKVRLQNRELGTTLVACSDKKTVIHVKLDEYKSTPENSVWLIKIEKPYKSIHFESVYGTVLGCTSDTVGGILIQKKLSDRFSFGSQWRVDDSTGWGKMVQFIACSKDLPYSNSKDLVCAVAEDSQVIKLAHYEQYYWRKIQLDYWSIEDVETPLVVDVHSLVGKKVRLRNGMLGTTLVASNNKKSVVHINIDDYQPKPEGSVWLIKSVDKATVKKTKKSMNKYSVEFLLESAYGTVLAWSSEKPGFKVLQTGKCSDSYWSRWMVFDNFNSGFTTVLIMAWLPTCDVGKLNPVTGSSQVELRESFQDSYCYWELEVVEIPTITSSQAAAVAAPPEQIRSASYAYQVHQMYVNYNNTNNQDGIIPFPNYNVNSGRNVNESGTQIVGSVNVQTKIGKWVNQWRIFNKD